MYFQSQTRVVQVAGVSPRMAMRTRGHGVPGRSTRKMRWSGQTTYTVRASLESMPKRIRIVVVHFLHIHG